jgi:hypothetical protein
MKAVACRRPLSWFAAKAYRRRVDDDESDDLGALIDRARGRASLPPTSEAQSWVAVQTTEPPAPPPASPPPMFDDGD